MPLQCFTLTMHLLQWGKLHALSILCLLLINVSKEDQPIFLVTDSRFMQKYLQSTSSLGR